MSLQFNDTANLRGLVQMYEREIGFKVGDVSGNTTRLKQFTADVNLALDDFIALAIQASGTWQFDDSNHEKYPFIEADLISGQRDYNFTIDQQGNLILDIFKVMVKDSGGVYKEIDPVDQQTQKNTSGFFDGRNTTGTPSVYDKTANGIFLEPIPNYNWRLANEGSKGLKVFINREGSYFVYTDLTKKPGIPGVFHAYLYLKPALEHARRSNSPKERKIKEKIVEMEAMINEHFGRRAKDEVPRLTVRQESCK